MTHSSDSENHYAEKARFWVQRMASGDTTGPEIAQLKAWLAQSPLHARAFEKERAFWQDIGAHRALFEQGGGVVEKHRKVQPLRAGRRLSSVPSVLTKRRTKIAAAVAAMLAIAVMMVPEIWLNLRADYRTGAGAMQTVVLSDRSRMVLDSKSAVTIAYNKTERRLDVLRGRVWFEVAHGDPRPFRVEAAGGVTEDIGTAFEIERRSDEHVGVGVSEGAVRVMASAGARAVELKAGQRAEYSDGIASRKATIAADKIASWRHGEILIDNVPFAEAVDVIRRYHQGAIWVIGSDAFDRRVSGIFRTDRPEDALKAMAASSNLRVITLPAGITIVR